jgi:heterodisulfide reductase subunit B
MMEIGYYPGCALHGSSNDYEKSVQACMGALGARLKELDDWICCGASAAHVINKALSLALPARNLGLAERDGVSELLAPCPMCSMELIKARRELADNPDLRRKISEIVEIGIEAKTDVINLIQVFQKIGLETIRAAVKKPVEGIKAACYYGCLLTRPASVLEFDDCEHPRSMESILEVLGVESVEWNYKTECCGAGMTMANEALVLELSNKILANAKAHGANCLVVACPMCHVNLDMKQADVERQYGTNSRHAAILLIGPGRTGLGLSEQELGIDKHFVVKR